MNFVAVIVITAIVVVAMINFRGCVNRSEAMRAMEDLGRRVLEYRKTSGSVPPESYVNRIKPELEGYVRLGRLRYRALWIDSESTDDEILAYTEIKSHSLLFGDGFIVLRLDGRIEWMDKQEFEPLLARQQSPMEIKWNSRNL